MRKVFGAQIAYLALLDKATNTIHFRYGYGDAFPSRPFGAGMTSRIIQTGEPLLINEDIGGRTAQLNITRSGAAAKSYLGVPIPVGSEVIGVLSVQSTEEEGRFTDADLRLLTDDRRQRRRGDPQRAAVRGGGRRAPWPRRPTPPRARSSPR